MLAWLITLVLGPEGLTDLEQVAVEVIEYLEARLDVMSLSDFADRVSAQHLNLLPGHCSSVGMAVKRRSASQPARFRHSSRWEGLALTGSHLTTGGHEWD